MARLPLSAEGSREPPDHFRQVTGLRTNLLKTRYEDCQSTRRSVEQGIFQKSLSSDMLGW